MELRDSVDDERDKAEAHQPLMQRQMSLSTVSMNRKQPLSRDLFRPEQETFPWGYAAMEVAQGSLKALSPEVPTA